MSAECESLPPLAGRAFGAPPWAPLHRLPHTDLPKTADVVIVGAGLTGLRAAAVCADAGRDVVVLEKQFGSGATARSGGVVLGETLVGPDEDFDDCAVALRAFIERAAIDCGLVWAGCKELRRDRSLPAHPIDWRDSGHVRMATTIDGGGLDPARLQQALADIARRAGVTVVDDAIVERMERCGGTLRIDTTRGSIAAPDVVMAVDATGWSAAFDPWTERVMTVAMHTAAIDATVLDAAGLRTGEAFYTADLPLLWGRVLPDRSLLIGRETFAFERTRALDDVEADLRRAGDRLTARVRGLHDAFATLDVREIWTGPIARNAAGKPALVEDPRLPRVTWAGGYGGHGIAQAFRLGQRAGERLLSTR